MLGINECGYPMSSLLSAYQEDIDTLKSLQPDATIYLLKVYGVSRSVAESASYFSPPAPTGGQRRHRRSGRRQEGSLSGCFPPLLR